MIEPHRATPNIASKKQNTHAASFNPLLFLFLALHCLEAGAVYRLRVMKDATQRKADRVYASCAAAYEREARTGADRALRFCEEGRKAVFVDASRQALAALKDQVPASCRYAVAAFEASLQQFESAQALLAQQLTLARPGKGERDQAGRETLAARSNEFYIESVVERVRTGLDFSLCDE